MSLPPPSIPSATPVALPADSSLWDRISTWVSENKAVVYTIAGVAVVVTTAGAVYYVSNSSSSVSRSDMTWASRYVEPAKVSDDVLYTEIDFRKGQEERQKERERDSQGERQGDRQREEREAHANVSSLCSRIRTQHADLPRSAGKRRRPTRTPRRRRRAQQAQRPLLHNRRRPRSRAPTSCPRSPRPMWPPSPMPRRRSTPPS